MAVPWTPGAVQGGPDGPHLAVHHPAGGDHVGPGGGLGHGQLGVEREGGVVVHVPGDRVDHAAVAVVGELVEAAVGHHHHESPTASRTAARARWVIPSGRRAADPVASLSSGRGSPNRMTPGTPEAAQALDLDGQRVDGVLHHAGQRRDRAGLVQPVGHEQRGHQVVDGQAGLGHQPPQGRAPPQPPQAGGRESGPGAAAGTDHRTAPRLRQSLDTVTSLTVRGDRWLSAPPEAAARSGDRPGAAHHRPSTRPSMVWRRPRRPPQPGGPGRARGDRADGDHHRWHAGGAEQLDGPLDGRRRGEGDGVGPPGGGHRLRVRGRPATVR